MLAFGKRFDSYSPLMPIRLLALDLDHTVLTNQRQIHPKNLAAVQIAVQAGVQVVLASGRMMLTMLPFAQQLGLSGPLVCCNGALVVDEKLATLTESVLPVQVFDLLFAYAETRNVQINAYTKEQLLILKTSHWMDEYAQRVRSVVPIHVSPVAARSLPLLKVLFLDDAEAVAQHRSHLEPLIDPSLARITVSEPEYLEFLPSNVSKGQALAFLADRMGILQSETAAIGDFDNDVEMISWAGLGGAVANASPNALAVADVVVGSNEDGGVAEFIMSHVLHA